jgi:hypothetical protein
MPLCAGRPRLVIIVAFSLATHTTGASQARPPIGIIDFYGLRQLSDTQVRSALGFKIGEIAPDSTARKAAEARLRALPNVVDAHVASVCCEDGKTILYVGLREPGAPTLWLRAAPRGNTRLPEEIVQAGRVFEKAFAAAMTRGDFAEDHSHGHALMHDPPARAAQERFVALAERHMSRLRDVLRQSSDSSQRALAAQVLGYARDKQAVVTDPDRRHARPG